MLAQGDSGVPATPEPPFGPHVMDGHRLGSPGLAALVALDSPRLAALAAALSALADASDDVAAAVGRHDRAALEAASGRAEALVSDVAARGAVLTVDDRAALDVSSVPAICERLDAGARRNAYLIERAWAADAALIRLLAGLGQRLADGGAGEYGSAPGPAFLERDA